jgi:peptidoglycan/xylan/chitin deacetylase (PgdA/CDA1 family)
MSAFLLNWLSPRGANARLSTLIFHRVLAEPDPLFPSEIDAAQFDRICGWLREWFHVLPLDQACRRLRDGSLPARALAITFDDGYADNHDLALPILQKHGLTATFFVATGFLDGGRMWNDTVIETVRHARAQAIDVAGLGLPELGHLPLASVQERQQAIHQLLNACKYLPIAQREQTTAALALAADVQLPADLMMRSDQVQALHRAGMLIGGHTAHHPILARLDEPEARAEMHSGKATLEALTQAPVTTFAYPNGRPGRDYQSPHVAMARELGFEFAVTTAPGVARRDTDPHQLPRFTPWDRSRWRFALRMAGNLRSDPAQMAATAAS